jgi:hypothetical protein
MNVVEIHVLDAIRRHHKIRRANIRQALRYIRRHFPSPYPLTNQEFVIDVLDLFIQKYGQLINISQSGQLAMRTLIEVHLQWIE